MSFKLTDTRDKSIKISMVKLMKRIAERKRHQEKSIVAFNIKQNVQN